MFFLKKKKKQIRVCFLCIKVSTISNSLSDKIQNSLGARLYRKGSCLTFLHLVLNSPSSLTNSLLRHCDLCFHSVFQISSYVRLSNLLSFLPETSIFEHAWFSFFSGLSTIVLPSPSNWKHSIVSPCLCVYF